MPVLANMNFIPGRELDTATTPAHPATPATPATLYVPPHRRSLPVTKDFPPCVREPRDMPVMPRSDNKSLKIWIAVRLMEQDSLRARKRSGDPTDTGGKCAPILTSAVLRGEKPNRNQKKGRYACTSEITTQFHIEHTSEFREATVGVSKAAGPFDQEIRAAINAGGYWTGAAYPDKNGVILDTQLCVSGAPKHGEPLIDAARREVMEELGMAVELRTADLPARMVQGVTHHLFWAEAH